MKEKRMEVFLKDILFIRAVAGPSSVLLLDGSGSHVFEVNHWRNSK